MDPVSQTADNTRQSAQGGSAHHTNATHDQVTQLAAALSALHVDFGNVERPLLLEEYSLKVIDRTAPQPSRWARWLTHLRIYTPDNTRLVFAREACNGYVNGRRFAILLEVYTGTPYGLRFFGSAFPLDFAQLMQYASADEIGELIRQVCVRRTQVRSL